MQDCKTVLVIYDDILKQTKLLYKCKILCVAVKNIFIIINYSNVYSFCMLQKIHILNINSVSCYYLLYIIKMINSN